MLRNMTQQPGNVPHGPGGGNLIDLKEFERVFTQNTDKVVKSWEKTSIQIPQDMGNQLRDVVQPYVFWGGVFVGLVLAGVLFSIAASGIAVGVAFALRRRP